MTAAKRKILYLTAVFSALECCAITWSLPTRAWTRITPPGPWRLVAISRNDEKIVTLDSTDLNWRDNRLMFSLPDGDPWSLPAVHVEHFSSPGEQQLFLLTGKRGDVAIAYEVRFRGRVAYSVSVEDPKKKPEGANGNALFRVELLPGGDLTASRKLKEFTWRGKHPVVAGDELDVAPGDLLLFRKTSNPDDYLNGKCHVSVSVAATQLEEFGNWAAFAVPSDRITVADYRVMPGRWDGERVLFNCNDKLPLVTIISKSDTAAELRVRAERNDKTPGNAGDAVASYRIPADGNYRLELELSNPGVDVKGGDGGIFKLNYLPPGSEVDSSELIAYTIPASSDNQEPIRFDRIMKLRKGDRLAFRFNAKIDSYADLFRLKFRLTPTEVTGEIPPQPSPDALLPSDRGPCQEQGIPLKPGAFWICGHFPWFHQPQAVESMRLIQKFMPQTVAVLHGNRPDRLPLPQYMRDLQIPALMQNFGTGFEPYFRYYGAFEWDISGRCMAEKQPGVSLSGGAHAVAQPHPAFQKAFCQLGRSSVMNGYSGYGFNDLTWHWGSGRGKAGYSPETVKAFRADLAGRDAGFRVAFGEGAEQTFHFADYVKFYFGASPAPAWFGWSSWEHYQPPSPESNGAEQLLFDLLVHYEYLKTADRIGDAVEKAGGRFQVLPNPEDLANGIDALFLAGLTRVYARTEEYFRSNVNMNALYNRFPYLKNLTSHEREYGIVLETGWGGNADPYYSTTAALRSATEATIAGKFDHFEGDFWPSSGYDIKNASLKSSTNRRRYAILLAYALGFKYGREDAAFHRLKPEFISITSRQIFRPWGAVFYPWTWWLNTANSPEQAFARDGYPFFGAGDESAANGLLPKLDTVVLSASPMTEACYLALKKDLRSGERKQLIVAAPILNQVMGKNLHLKPFSSLEPELRITPVGPSEGIDLLYHVEGPGVRTEMTRNGKPIVVSFPVGKGRIYVICFAIAAAQENAPEPNPEVRKEVFDTLFVRLGIQSHWRSSDPVQALLYTDGERYLTSGLRYDLLNKHGKERYPDFASDTASYDVRLKPGLRYRAISYPDLAEQQVCADQNGFARINLGKQTYGLFYLVPEHDRKTLECLRARAEEFRQAMTLDGRWEEPIE